MNRFVAPIKLARGLGAAKDGTGHFIAQRVTALALIPLVLWFCWNLATRLGGGHAAAVAFIAQPWNTVLLLALVYALFRHSALGVQVVIEDYVAHPFWKPALLLASLFAHTLLALAAAVSILKISIGA